MSKTYRGSFERLHLFLADTEGETHEEISRQLQAAGVDVGGFVRDVKSMLSQSSPVSTKRSSRLARFTNLTRAEIVNLLRKLQAGTSAMMPASVLSQLEDSDFRDLTDEQLRDLLIKVDEESEGASEK